MANNEKERVKVYLRNDIQSMITNVTHESNEIHNMIAAISYAAGGSCSGADVRMIGDCQRALQDLSKALQELSLCREYVEQLDTKEWIEDDE